MLSCVQEGQSLSRVEVFSVCYFVPKLCQRDSACVVYDRPQIRGINCVFGLEQAPPLVETLVALLAEQVEGAVGKQQSTFQRREEAEIRHFCSLFGIIDQGVKSAPELILLLKLGKITVGDTDKSRKFCHANERVIARYLSLFGCHNVTTIVFDDISSAITVAPVHANAAMARCKRRQQQEVVEILPARVYAGEFARRCEFRHEFRRRNGLAFMTVPIAKVLRKSQPDTASQRKSRSANSAHFYAASIGTHHGHGGVDKRVWSKGERSAGRRPLGQAELENTKVSGFGSEVSNEVNAIVMPLTGIAAPDLTRRKRDPPPSVS